MKQNKLIAKLLTLVVVISTILQIFPMPTYSKEEAKIQAVSEYIKDKEVLEAKIDEALSTEDQMLIDVLVKKDTKDMILVFQKSLKLTDNSLLPDGIEVDKNYKDTGIYGESYTSIRLKAKDKKEETKKETSDKSTLEISTSEGKIKTVKEEISLAFDVKRKLENGDLFAVISDEYISLVENKIEKDEISKESPVKEEDKNKEYTETPKTEPKKEEKPEDKKLLEGEPLLKDPLEKDESFGIMAKFLRSPQPVLDSSFFGKFTLKKKDENDKPLPKAKFTLSDNKGDFSKTLESDNAGKIVFENIPPGEYTLKETEAPDGYELLEDYYKITVNKYGFTTATYVRVSNSQGSEGNTGGTPNTPNTPSIPRKTSGVVTVEEYSFESTNPKSIKDGVDSVGVTSGELIRMRMKLKVKEGTRAGDSFTIKLDDRLSPTGIRERHVPPLPLKIKNQLVASGIYDEKTNSCVYTFTDYVERHKNVEIDVTYNTFGPDSKKILNSGLYEFTNTIDEQKQKPVKLYIDYGPSFEMPSGYNKGRKMRNNVTSVDRHAGIVERVIYLNNGNTPQDVMHGSTGKMYLELTNHADSTILDYEVYRVKSSQKDKYMPDSTPGVTDGLQRLRDKQLRKDDAKKTYRLIFEPNDFLDGETRNRSAGLLIKVKERLSSFKGQVDITATWGYTSVIGSSIGMRASVVDSMSSSDGNSERFNIEISMINKRIKTTDITVDKKWFTADGKEVKRNEGSITYDLIQVATTKDGKTTEKVYKSGETLTSQENWMRKYSGLQLQGTNDVGEEVTYTYYIVEKSVQDYDTSYSNSLGNESKTPKDMAISSGSITIKNTEKMKFVLPETGGMGRNTIYALGILMIITALFVALKNIRVKR